MAAADLTSFYESPDLLEAQKSADQTSQSYVEYQSAAAMLPQKLRDAIQQKLDYNRDLIEQTNKSFAEYGQAPAEARAKYADPTSESYIFNPFQAEKLVSETQAQAYVPFANLSDILSERRGTISDLVTAGTKAFNSQVLAQQGKAELAKGNFDRALELAKFKADAQYKEDQNAIETMKLKTTGGITGVPQIDELSDADAVALVSSKLGIDLTGTTATERGAKARDLLAEYVNTGKVSTNRYLSTLPTTSSAAVSSLTDVIKRATELSTTISNRDDISGPIRGRTSKFMADIFGKSSDASMYGKELEEMSADKIKERYGGALTTTEVSRLTKQAITNRNVQEGSNIESLNIMKKNALSLLREKLTAAGWKKEVIDQYIAEIDRPPLSSFDK